MSILVNDARAGASVDVSVVVSVGDVKAKHATGVVVNCRGGRRLGCLGTATDGGGSGRV